MSNTTTYKQTAIGLIPSDWEVRKLGDITLIKGDYGINAAAVDFDNDLPSYLRITDIDDDGNFNSEKKKSVDDINSSNFYLNKNDLVFVRTGATVGKSYLYKENDGKLVFAGFLIRFRVDTSKANDYFLWTYTKSKPYWDWVKAVSTRSGQPGINSTEYSSLQIPLPPLPEQQKIAAILSTWDSAIDNCKAIIEKLKVRNKGLSQKLFSKKFEEKHLHELFEKITTKNVEKNQNVITISAQRGFVKQTDFFNKVIASDVLDNYFLVKKGDFCYNKSYSNGYDWGATKRLNDFEKAVVTTLYICFRLKDENQNSGDFFEYYFESGILNRGLSKVANEGGRAHGLLNVTSSDFFNIKIGVPRFEEQKTIAAILNKATAELNQYQQKLKTLQLQKKGLMQQLLTGKTRVKI